MTADVAIRGARGHYAVPSILHRAGMLGTFYTDAYLGNKPLLRMVINQLPAAIAPAALQRLAGRFAPGLPSSKVVSFDALGFKARWRPRAARSQKLVFESGVSYNREFARAVARHGLRGADAVYAVSGGALEIFAEARRAKMTCILEQVSLPARIYEQLVRDEFTAWPGWEPEVELGAHTGAVIEREEAEWPLADLILPASESVAHALRSLGVPAAKCRVVPLGVNTGDFRVRPDRGVRQTLNVLFAGYVSLRKGVPYLLEALRLLDSLRVRCRLVGLVEIDARRLAQYGKWIEVAGVVPRQQMVEHYQWADVLVFPSIAEGFGLVACEAFSCGVPVIANANSGSVVTDGSDGFIVPLRNSEAIACRLEQLLADRALLSSMSHHALKRSQDFSLESYGVRLVSAIESINNSVNRQGGGGSQGVSDVP